jgi:hypothetical protein
MSARMTGWNPDEWEQRRADKVVPMPLVLHQARLPDPATIPPREWLYSTILVRRFVTLIVAPGGTGKSLYSLGVALSLAAGRPLLGEYVHHQVNAWAMNLEDPLDEIDRRVAAMMLRHGVARHEVEGRLFLHSGRDRRLMMAQRSDDGYSVVFPDKDAVIAGARAGNVGLIVVDPFVKSHQLEENSNPDMDAAATAWAEVGDATGAAILLVHHTRKGDVAGIDSARGGKALTDAARVGLTMASMTPEEAGKLGVEEAERWQFVRVDDQKVNMSPRADKAKWFRMATVELGNGTEMYRHGDRVAALEAWDPPSVWKDVTDEQVGEVLDAVEAGLPGGGKYAPSRRGARNGRWVGNVVIEKLGVDAAQAQRMVAQWLRSGLLFESRERDADSRKDVVVVVVNHAKRPGARG